MVTLLDMADGRWNTVWSDPLPQGRQELPPSQEDSLMLQVVEAVEQPTVEDFVIASALLSHRH